MVSELLSVYPSQVSWVSYHPLSSSPSPTFEMSIFQDKAEL